MAGINIIAPPLSSITGLGSGVAGALAVALNAAGGLAPVTSPVFTGPTLGVATFTSLTGGAVSIGALNSTLITFTSGASGAGVVGTVSGGGSNESFTLTPKGSGTVNISSDLNLGLGAAGASNFKINFNRGNTSGYARLLYQTNGSEIVAAGLRGDSVVANSYTIDFFGRTALSLVPSAGYVGGSTPANVFVSVGTSNSPAYLLTIAPISGAPLKKTFYSGDKTSTTGQSGNDFAEGQGQSTWPLIRLLDSADANPVGLHRPSTRVLAINDGTTTANLGDLQCRNLFTSLPTSASGLAAGQLWNNSGVVNVA